MKKRHAAKHRGADPLNGRHLSDVVAQLPEQFSGTHVTIAELKDALSGRSYGFLMLMLALPNLIPIPAPGLSAALGAPLLLFTFQLMLGVNTPWFPSFIACKRLPRAGLARVCTRVAPYLRRLEVVFRPRLGLLVTPPADRVIALLCTVLACTIMMPIPFGNAIPALAVCLFAVALLQRDGLFALLGVLCTVLAFTAITVFFGALQQAAEALVSFFSL